MAKKISGKSELEECLNEYVTKYSAIMRKIQGAWEIPRPKDKLVLAEEQAE